MCAINDNRTKRLKLKVSALENGTVIDHIPSESLFKVISILELEKTSNMITFGANLDSSTQGSKAIIKVANQYFAPNEVDKIALIAPNAKINVIKDYEVVEKKVVEVPDTVMGIVRCFNPKCITNNEAIRTSFQVTSKSPIHLKCKYCEKITYENQIVIK
ncbi:MAG: aspartate carbamoyltransferase regulatory subunit [Mangrovibacterium sp.]